MGDLQAVIRASKAKAPWTAVICDERAYIVRPRVLKGILRGGWPASTVVSANGCLMLSCPGREYKLKSVEKNDYAMRSELSKWAHAQRNARRRNRAFEAAKKEPPAVKAARRVPKPWDVKEAIERHYRLADREPLADDWQRKAILDWYKQKPMRRSLSHAGHSGGLAEVYKTAKKLGLGYRTWSELRTHEKDRLSDSVSHLAEHYFPFCSLTSKPRYELGESKEWLPLRNTRQAYMDALNEWREAQTIVRLWNESQAE